MGPWSRSRRVIVERTLKPLNPSPQGTFWKQCEEEFRAYVTNLTQEEGDAFQIVQLYRQRGDAENVFDELKQAYQRLLDWLARTAPQLNLTMGKAPPWLLFDPTHPTMSAVH